MFNFSDLCVAYISVYDSDLLNSHSFHFSRAQIRNSEKVHSFTFIIYFFISMKIGEKRADTIDIYICIYVYIYIYIYIYIYMYTTRES